MVYGDFKDLTRRTASDKTLHDDALDIAKNPKYDGYQQGLDKQTSGSLEKVQTKKSTLNFYR